MDFAIALDADGPLPLYRQLSEKLRQLILSGQLLPGQRLPSTRGLAGSLGISRTTVTQSYEQLLSEGYLQAVGGSGTFVSQQLPEELLRPLPVQAALAAAQAGRRPIQFSTYGSSLQAADPFVAQTPDSLISFRYGRPALDQIPLKQWRRLWSRHCRLEHPDLFDYTLDPLGYRPLREAIVRCLSRSRAMQCDPDQVIIINEPLQGIDLVTRVLVERGDGVALENPSFSDIHCLFRAQGARLWPVAVDEAGLVVEQLPLSESARIRLVYVTPSHQFPTGVVLSLARRLELLAWASASGAIILEDDYDSEYRYGGPPIPALQGLDRNDCVVYVGSFMEALFPALRLGYLVVPRPLVEVLARARWFTDRQSPLLEQRVLTDFINEGHLERHVRRMRRLYDQRRQSLIQALSGYLGNRVSLLGENAGMHLTIRLHTTLSDEELVRRAAQVGVGLVHTRWCYLGANCPGEFLLGYADLNPPQIQEGVRRLAQVLAEAAVS